MKAVVQRVTSANVRVGGEVRAEVGRGMLILLGVMRADTEAEAERLAERIARFRFFPDEDGRMNRSALEEDLGALVVSQFTLAADGKKGRRPSFDRAAPGPEAEELYEHFVAHLSSLGVRCETGSFGAMMEVGLVNDGPVTFVLEQEGSGSGGP